MNYKKQSRAVRRFVTALLVTALTALTIIPAGAVFASETPADEPVVIIQDEPVEKSTPTQLVEEVSPLAATINLSTYTGNLTAAIAAATAGDTITIDDNPVDTTSVTIDKEITIRGAEDPIYTLSAQLLITAGPVTIENLNISYGNTYTDNNSVATNNEAVINISGNNIVVSITNSTITQTLAGEGILVGHDEESKNKLTLDTVTLAVGNDGTSAQSVRGIRVRGDDSEVAIKDSTITVTSGDGDDYGIVLQGDGNKLSLYNTVVTANLDAVRLSGRGDNTTGHEVSVTNGSELSGTGAITAYWWAKNSIIAVDNSTLNGKNPGNVTSGGHDRSYGVVTIEDDEGWGDLGNSATGCEITITNSTITATGNDAATTPADKYAAVQIRANDTKLVFNGNTVDLGGYTGNNFGTYGIDIHTFDPAANPPDYMTRVAPVDFDVDINSNYWGPGLTNLNGIIFIPSVENSLAAIIGPYTFYTDVVNGNLNTVAANAPITFIDSVKINGAVEHSHSFMADGSNKTLAHTVSVVGTASNKTVTWSSDNTGVATVNATGLVTFTGKEGVVKIKATSKHDPGKHHTKTITVIKNITKIRTPLANVNITKGKTLTLPVELEDGKVIVTDAGKTFTSSNTKIATVDKKGVIKGVKPGKANITVQSANGKKLTVKVTVAAKAVKITSFTITGTPKKDAMKVGASSQLGVKLNPAKASDLKITYKSSNAKIISVDKAGKITALKAGKATITVKVGNKSVKTKLITVK
ncbi:MAG: Ig-like domain-containing protein [Clostridiales Family XIII bacterium]|jgi:uncharacterized protein YjdB|nr:Ig-like domain-containing protein [Clostridiales Family XIII bacterium]